MHTTIAEHVRAGISVRYLYEQILVDDATGVAGDIGVQVDTPLEGLVAGAAIANIGSMNEMRNEAVRLPLLARFGAAYPIDLPSMDARVLLVADGLHLFREGTYAGCRWNGDSPLLPLSRSVPDINPVPRAAD